MKKLFIYFILFISISSCINPKEKILHQFLEAVSKNDSIKANTLYPFYKKFSSNVIIDQYKIINSTSLNDTIYYKIKNIHLNEYGINDTTYYSFFIKKDSLNKYKIINSKGFYNDSLNSKEKTYLIYSGALKYNDTTDITMYNKAPFCKKYIYHKFKLEYIHLMSKIKPKCRWEDNYFGEPKGTITIKNPTEYTFSKIQFIITYLDKYDNEMTTDSKYKLHEELLPHSSQHINFSNQYIYNVYSIRVLAYPEEDEVKQIMLNDTTNCKTDYQTYLHYHEIYDSLLDF